ncbi:MAG: HAD-IIB family hydrolase [Pseudomonadota bacterium]
MQTAPPLLVFSDLDGTLLDHTTYDWTAAKPALTRLQVLGAPVILATSKTAAETRILQHAMGLDSYPAIVENGAGLIDRLVSVDQTNSYHKLRKILDTLPNPLRGSFTGFGDMSVEKVMQITGLTENKAKAAKTRDFSEPGLWTGTPAAQTEFIEVLERQGVTARLGGRFLTLSFGTTKKDRMATIADRYPSAVTLALGDAPNDIEMLQAADYGVIVANSHHAPLPTMPGEKTGHITRTTADGPQGWNNAVCAFLDRLHHLKKGSDLG